MAERITPSSVTPVIGFLDVDSFECQIWQRQFPDSKGKPCVVATSSGRIVAVTYEAKAFGVSRSETPTLKQAYQVCPILQVFRKPDKWGKQDQSKVRETTAEIVRCVQDYLKKFTGGDVILEVASSDELYLDISAEISRGMEKRKGKLKEKNGDTKTPECTKIQFPHRVVWERQKETKRGPFLYRLPVKPKQTRLGMLRNLKAYGYKNEERLMFGALFMDELCQYLEKHTHLQASAGVAKNKLLAKIGCGLNKPQKVTVLFEEAVNRISSLVPISNIPGLGGQIGIKLKDKFEIQTMREIPKIPYEKLVEEFEKEDAQRIYSLAFGQDVEPVVYKITKEHIQCNKSAGDIKNFTRLTKVIKDLTSEIQVILQEEKKRHSRTTHEVVVKYKLNMQAEKENPETDTDKENKLARNNQVATDTENHTFQIVDPNSKLGLPIRVLNHFLELPNFNRKDIHITSLSFLLKNFVPLTCPPKDFSSSSEDLTPTPSKTLRIHPKNLPANITVPTFKHTVVGSFRITANLQYSTKNTELPKLSSDDDLKHLVGFQLMKDYYGARSCTKIIQDYTTYDGLKHEFFSKWLRQEKPNIEELNDVRFVMFHGRLLRALKTPANLTHGEWETFGMNVDNVIYLWDEKSPRSNMKFSQENAYIGQLFEYLVSGRKQNIKGIIEGMENVFPIQKAEFDKHKMLLVTNVDAQDSEGQFVQVQMGTDEIHFKRKNLSFFLERKMKLWSQSVTSGATKIVRGSKDHNNVITKMEIFSVEEFGATVEDKDSCLIFLNRLLDWINLHLKEPNEKLVKKFAWMPGNKSGITCSIIPQHEVGKLLVPRFYFKK